VLVCVGVDQAAERSGGRGSALSGSRRGSPGSRRREREGGRLALGCDPRVEVLAGDPKSRSKLDGLKLAIAHRAPNRRLGELAGGGDVRNRHQRLGR
jgi:hypothetical protein